MARTSLLVGWLLAAALVALASVLFARASDPQAANLLSNGGFENGTSDWVWLGGTLAINGQLYEGNYSGAIQLASSAPAVIRQDVSIEPGGSYALSGRFLFTNPSVTQVILELDWQGDQDVLERQQFRLEDSDGSSWLAALVQLDPLPCDAISSQVRIQVVGQPGAIALLDDLRLKGLPPATPCPSPTVTPTASPVPTEASPPQPTPTRTPSPAAAPPGSPTPTRTATSTRTPTATRTATVIPPVTATAPPSATPSATIAAVTPTPSNGLIVNGGFESVEGGDLVGWQTFGGALFQTSEPVWGGLYAACFVSETTSTKWVYQTVPVAPVGWYEMSGYIYQNDPGISAALLRVSWYESVDASGSAISTADSTEELGAPENAYRLLTTGPVQAPPNAHSANARVLLRPQSAASARICVDDVSFTSTNPPAPAPAATAFATATASATSTPTATWPVTPTRTATATPPSQPAPTATATYPATPTVPAVAMPTATPTLPASSTAVPPVTATRTPTATRRSTLAASPTAAAEPAADPPPLGELLVNSGFESVGENGPTGWSKHGGVLGQVSDPVHSGAFAAEMYSATDSTKWLFQTVVVEADDWYELQAYICDDDPWVAAAFLRVSWYESNDGSGSAIAQADSTGELTVPDASYRQLTTGPLRAPPNARSAAVRVLLRPRDATAAVIHVDDVSFGAVAPPDPPAEETAGEAPASGPPAEPSGAPSASNAPASGYTSSTLGVSLRAAPAPIVPQPTPVIRRYSSLSAPVEALPGEHGARWWPWALVVGAIVAAVAGWVAYAWGRVRRAES